MSPGRLTAREITLDLDSPTHICASRDHGAGVCFGPDTFAIYSLVPPPISCQHLLGLHAAVPPELTAAGLRVCETLPVYVNMEKTALTELSSLPVPHVRFGHDSVVHRPPWFLIRAAAFEKHCVVGTNSVVEALLVILQRPWCVLEICCCDNRTVAAVLEFAKLAANMDPGTYGAAVQLLTHEQAMRSTNSTGRSLLNAVLDDPFPAYRTSSTSMMATLRDIYAATCVNGIRSNNPFWLMLICSCAVYLDVAFSDIIRRIQDQACEQPKCIDQQFRYQTYLISLYRELLRKIRESVT